MPNRLAAETSPYLLQHKDNPVDWYPWGPEALERSRKEDKPIFLSIGYSACHWCHVMAHESFENDQIAAALNEKFVNIKVDREERPDLDQIYMSAVQIMTRSGGWPMSVFLTPDLKPFYGGTYWPPEPRMGMPGFAQIVHGVDDAWQHRRQAALDQAEQLTEHLQQLEIPPAASGGIDERLLAVAATGLEEDFDTVHGGFGTQPKFPHAMALQFMLRMWRRTGRESLLQKVRLNLDKMARGGIYDHLAGGFSRYSVDARWLVPHFEKMLYDNALLSGVYLDGFLATGDQQYAAIVRETCDYVLGYMTDAAGGFHSAEDADSEGVEGKFYVWTPEEIHQVLGPERAERFCFVYDVTEGGNFEGKSILNLPVAIDEAARTKGWELETLERELAESRRRLLAVRDHRVRPGRDDKILLGWNALMIDSLARAAGALDESRYLDAAAKAARFILTAMSREDGRLLHCWREGQAKLDAYLDDYAFFIDSLVTLYEADFDPDWIDHALRLTDIVLTHFRDPNAAGFFYTADDHEQLIARNKDLYESSIPSGNSVMAAALIRLGKLCGRGDFLQAAADTVRTAAGLMQRAPSGVGRMLVAADMLQGPFFELVVVGESRDEATRSVVSDLHQRYLPNRVAALCEPGGAETSSALADLFAGKSTDGEQPALFICRDFACAAPVSGVEAIRQALDGLAENTPSDASG
jgi:uncharacterized protein YyaL (SSP411 family)